MKELTDFTNDSFSCEILDQVAIVRTREAIVEFGLDLNKRDSFFSFLSHVEDSPDINALMLINAPGSLCDRPYVELMMNLAGMTSSQISSKQWVDRDVLLEKKENGLNQYILRATKFQKIIVSCLQGEVAAPHFGVSLASDFRLVAKNTTILTSHRDIAIPPGGGLGFFLPRYVGQGRAAEILLSKNHISPEEALELGLVNSILPEDGFDSRCIDATRGFCNLPSEYVARTRRLLYPYAENLDNHLSTELDEIRRAMIEIHCTAEDKTE